jgi:hypothetical protein
MRKYKKKIRNRNLQSEDLDAIILKINLIINEKQKGYSELSDDDINTLEVLKFLLTKYEERINKLSFSTQNEQLNYNKVRNIVNDLSLNEIITDPLIGLGGDYFFEILDKVRFRNYLYKSIELIIQKVPNGFTEITRYFNWKDNVLFSKIVIGIVIAVIGTVIGGIILGHIQLPYNSSTPVNDSIEMNGLESYDNQITPIIILEPTWVYKDKPVLSFNNQILIKVSSPSSFIQCATFDLKITDQNSIHWGLICIGERRTFSYNNYEYIFDVLEINDRGAKVTITKLLQHTT